MMKTRATIVERPRRRGAFLCALSVALICAHAHEARAPRPSRTQSESFTFGEVDGRFGEYQFTLTSLKEPTRTAISTGNEIYVVERWAHRIRVYSSPEPNGGAGELLTTVGSRGSAAGELRDPSGIALLETASETRLFVADTGNHRIAVFNKAGEHVQSIGSFGSELGQLKRPTDIAVTADRLFVSDTGNNRVVVLDLEGNPLFSFGSSGTARGGLREPAGLAMDGAGRLLVADAGNHRVVRWTSAGEVDLEFGDRGPYPGLFSTPTDVEWSDGRIYVADRGNHRIAVFDDHGHPLYEWGIHVLRPREGEGRLHYPSGVTIAPGGEFAVVCEAASDRVQVFGAAAGPAAKYMTDPAIFSQGPARHFGMNIDAAGAVLVIAEPETESVLVYAIEGTTPLMVTKLGGLGPLADDFVRVDDVDLSEDGREIVATDAGARRMGRFRLERAAESELRYDLQLGRFIEGANFDRLPLEGQVSEPTSDIEPGAIVRDGEGRIFVVDRGRARVLRFSKGFELERVFGSEGSKPGQLRSPSDLALSADGHELWVVDAGNARLSVFSTDGSFLRTVGENAGMDRPHGIALRDDGGAYVTDAGMHRVHVFNSAGELAGGWGQAGLDASEFFKPRGIALDGEGRVIVLDHGNHRGQIFAQDGEFLSAFGARLYVRETRRKKESQ